MDDYVLKKILESIDSDSLIKGNFVKNNVIYNSKNKVFNVFYKSLKHFSPKEYFIFKEKFDIFSGPKLLLTLDQQYFTNQLFENSAIIADFLREICLYYKQNITSIFDSLTITLINNNQILILFDNETNKKIFDNMELDEYIKNYFNMVYNCDLLITTHIREKDSFNGVVNGVLSNKEDYADDFDCKNENREKSKVEQYKEQLIPIDEINKLMPNTKCMIAGEVLSCEKTPLKNGELTKHKFILFDYTSSIMCFYIESKHSKKILKPKKGDFICVKGTFEQNQYERDGTVKISEILPYKDLARTDDYHEKRIELHAHTKMSAQDGVCWAKDIINRAVKWGHKAVAITDHGVVQAFPDAYKAAEGKDIKIIYGVEAYMFDDKKLIYEGEDDAYFEDEFIVFDIETTGLNPLTCEIIEIGAVRIKDKKILDAFQTFVKPSSDITQEITELTGITSDMLKDAPTPLEALKAFYDFCGSNSILAAHNSAFDYNFIFNKSTCYDIKFKNNVIDTIDICRFAWPNLKNYKLATVAKSLGINFNHHCAHDDAKCTASILLEAFSVFNKKGIFKLSDLDSILDKKANYKSARTFHIILLAKNKLGLNNLYKLISKSHMDYFYRRPRMPKSLIEKYREGIIIGSACEAGELYRAVMEGHNKKELKSIALFYDYLEIQPISNNYFMIEKQIVNNIEEIREFNRQIIQLGDNLHIPVVATCDVHFIDPHEAIYREIIQKNQKNKQADNSSPTMLYFRTTNEMLDEFNYLGEKKAYEVVITNANAIADSIETIQLFDSKTAMPKIEEAADFITNLAYTTAKKKYGDALPLQVNERLTRELESIVGNDFSVLYYSAHKIVKKSLDDGYLVGSRGSVGSSFAATMLGITEVNPLPPHYICSNCKYSDFNIDITKYTCGPDLPDKICPICGTALNKDGYDIPFEVFLGINANKVPDIDLNFSGVYQNTAHKYTEELFGTGYVFRAGTINGLKDRSAENYVRNYFKIIDKDVSEAEIARLKEGITGVKKTTGQHPGGMVIVPQGREIYEFTPVQRPADKQDAEFITTHFDFDSMHDILVKLDILAHDVPTIMRIIQDLTNVNPLEIPINDKNVIDLFSSTKPLGITSDELLGIKTGTLGIPEFGTKFVRQMLVETLPSTIEEIVRISGLSHGTDVWISNAQDLIKDGLCTLKEVICTRDDIMNSLVANGADKKIAFQIMEKVRKGKASKEGFTAEEEQAFLNTRMPKWFKESCLKIAYMFPKAHAVAYCIMSLRIAYYKLYYKEAFYASYFSVRANEFDNCLLCKDIEGLRNKWNEIQNLGKDASILNQKLQSMLEVVCEMRLRGLEFLPVDLNNSDSYIFKIENNGLRLPFIAISQLGEGVAESIVREREVMPFISVEDLKKRCRISSAAMEILDDMGTLKDLNKTNQLSFFSS